MTLGCSLHTVTRAEPDFIWLECSVQFIWPIKPGLAQELATRLGVPPPRTLPDWFSRALAQILQTHARWTGGFPALSPFTVDYLLQGPGSVPDGQADRERLGLGAYMRLGVGEERTGGRQRASNQADTLEAVLGAVFLDQGYPAATAVIQRLFGDALAGLAPQESRNPKGQLQEWAAQHHRLAPVYTTQGQSGPSHAPEFEVEVRVGDLLAAAGKGGSKQQAQKAAAAEALKALGLLGTAD